VGPARARVTLFVCVVALALLGLHRDAASAQASQQEIARGFYVFGATGGCGCLTAKA